MLFCCAIIFRKPDFPISYNRLKSNPHTVYTMTFSTLYHELVCHVEHYSVELDTLHQHMS